MKPSAEDRVAGTEEAISGLLRIGVATSLVLLAGGTLLSFVQDGGYARNATEVVRLVGPGGSFPRTGAWLWDGIVHFRGQAVIVAGLLLLIVTPVLRVAVSVVAFAREGDRTYALITAFVLILLIASFALGRAG
jgi:uncharacterized membrane protein